MGYAIAWKRRRALLAALVPVLIPVSLILLALRLLSGSDDAAVINGELVAPLPQGALGFVHAVVAGPVGCRLCRWASLFSNYLPSVPKKGL